MDYADWCEHVLPKLIEVTDEVPHGRELGVDVHELEQGLFASNTAASNDRDWAVVDALKDLESLGLITVNRSLYRPTLDGRSCTSNRAPLWERLCSIELEPEHRRLLQTLIMPGPLFGEHVKWYGQGNVDTKIKVEGNVCLIYGTESETC